MQDRMAITHDCAVIMQRLCRYEGLCSPKSRPLPSPPPGPCPHRAPAGICDMTGWTVPRPLALSRAHGSLPEGGGDLQQDLDEVEVPPLGGVVQGVAVVHDAVVPKDMGCDGVVDPGRLAGGRGRKLHAGRSITARQKKNAKKPKDEKRCKNGTAKKNAKTKNEKLQKKGCRNCRSKKLRNKILQNVKHAKKAAKRAWCTFSPSLPPGWGRGGGMAV